MQIEGKVFLVYGYKTAGRSAFKYLTKHNAKKVYVYSDIEEELCERDFFIHNFEEVSKLQIDYCILSPGVCVIGNKNLQTLLDNNIPFESDFSFAHKLLNCKSVCVTGTNGKTTTVNLVFDMIAKKYKSVFLCGNTNVPLFDVLDKTDKESIVVCEVSSFALETAKKITCEVSCVTNIASDHIARHKTFENYSNIKHSIYKNQKKGVFVCENNFLSLFLGQTRTCSCSDKNANAYIYKKMIFINNKKIASVKKFKLAGEKNLMNLLMAVSIAKYFDVSNTQIQSVINHATPQKHRLNFVCKTSGVTFINDSKSTNLASTICACGVYPNSILLLGGSDKGLYFDQLFENIIFKHIVVFGQMADKIKHSASKYNIENITKCNKMSDAVLFAKSLAKKGDVVLFSPACASFDEFENYKQRGKIFCELCKEKNWKR